MHTSDIELERFGDYRPTQFDQSGLGSEGQADWLVAPLSYQPKCADLLEESNWHAAVKRIEAASSRVAKARRRIARKLDRLFDREYVNEPFSDSLHGWPVEWFAELMCHDSAYTSDCMARLHVAVDLPLSPEAETVADFAERLDRAIETGDHEIHYFGHWTSDFEIIVVRPGSAAHRVAQEIAAQLADYPVLDESDFSERECEAQYESAQDELHSLELERNGEPLDGDAIGWLASEICSNANDNEPFYRGDIERALTRLGWVECDDDVWRLEAETE